MFPSRLNHKMHQNFFLGKLKTVLIKNTMKTSFETALLDIKIGFQAKKNRRGIKSDWYFPKKYKMKKFRKTYGEMTIFQIFCLTYVFFAVELFLI